MPSEAQLGAEVNQPSGQPRRARRAILIQTTLQLTRLAAALVLGVILPALLLALAYQAVGRLDDQVAAGADLAITAKNLPSPIAAFGSPNDYAFASIALLESGNQRVMLNKHRMKIAVMHIGFAVCCVGLLFIVLGIDAGGIELAGGVKESATINLKVASSGVAVFVLGASMAAAGGLLPNKYTTLGVPGYVAKAHISSMDGRSLQELSTTCEKDAATPEDIRRCVQAARSMLDAKE